MGTLTKIEITKKEEDEKKQNEGDKTNTKPKFPTRNDPKLRKTYRVPEEIYPENIDL